MLLELAPLSAGLIGASHSGASLGAELGSMKQTEQIDALHILGIDPIRELVGPRVLARMIALPLLHVLIAGLALVGGFIAGFDASPALYESAALSELHFWEVFLSGLKTVVFGFVIAAVGCRRGLRASGGTEGVGRAATRAVVGGMIGVMVADALMVKLIQVVAG